jgi:hypothetical protein
MFRRGWGETTKKEIKIDLNLIKRASGFFKKFKSGYFSYFGASLLAEFIYTQSVSISITKE